MEFPRKVVVGEGIIGKIGQVESRVSRARKILVLSGPTIYPQIRKELESSWDSAQRVSVEFVGPATMEEVLRIEELRKKDGCEVILGVGGGRVTDVAKMVSFRSNLDFVSVPTTASNDGMSSQFASIKGKGRPYSYVTRPPTSVVVDINVIVRAPQRLTSSGFGDAISKITAVEDWKLGREETGEYFGEYAAQLALMGAELALRNAEGIGRLQKNSVRTLVEALISDGVAAGIAGSSRPCSGSEHLFSHALDLHSKSQALHGEQCGVGTIMMAHLHGLDHERIGAGLNAAGAPTNASELGINKDDLVEALVLASELRPERYTILNRVHLTRAEALDLAKTTGVV